MSDLIDRQALIKRLKVWDTPDVMDKTLYNFALNRALEMPTIKAEPVRHGRWLPADKGDCTYICSECGFVRDAYILEEKAYCPRCGADMREVEE